MTEENEIQYVVGDSELTARRSEWYNIVKGWSTPIKADSSLYFTSGAWNQLKKNSKHNILNNESLEATTR